MLVALIGLGFGPEPVVRSIDGTSSITSLRIGPSTAEARPARRVVRRTARRTARRTTRRYNYLRTLPAGCPLRGAYYYCGGVYYQSVVQDGANVFIVVTP